MCQNLQCCTYSWKEKVEVYKRKMFTITACLRCESNRQATRCFSMIGGRKITLGGNVIRRPRLLEFLHRQLKFGINDFETGMWASSRMIAITRGIRRQNRRFESLVSAANNSSTVDSRSSNQAKKMSSESSQKRESILTVPNILCLTRIALAPVMAYLVMNSEHGAALMLLGVAGATDMLDGLIARNFTNQSTVFGSMLDPFADKVLMTIMTVTLAYADLLPVPLCVLIVGRDVAIMSAVAYLRFKTVPKPLTASKFFDANLPTVQMKPTFISKVNTGLQLALVGLCMAAPVFSFVDSYWLQVYWYLVGGTTIISGMSYVVQGSRTFRVVK